MKVSFNYIISFFLRKERFYLAGEPFRANEIADWYKIYTDAISRASNFITKPTAPTQGAIGLASHINNLAAVISAFQGDPILGKDVTVTYQTIDPVSVGQLIKRSTANQIIAGGNVLAVVKCRNQVTYSNSNNNNGSNNNGDNSNGNNSNGNNSYGDKSNGNHGNGSHSNGTCSNGTNSITCSNVANQNGGYSHGNGQNSNGKCQNGKNSNGVNSNIAYTNGSHSNGKKSYSSRSNGTKYNGSKSYGTNSRGTKTNGYNANGSNSTGACTNGFTYHSNVYNQNGVCP